MHKWRPNRQLEGYLFLLPNVIGFLMFTTFPVVFALYIAFTDWRLAASIFESPPPFVGFGNFVDLFQGDLIFKQVALNMVFYVAAIVPLQTGISLLIALALNQKLRGMKAFRLIYYMPVITTVVAGALVFQLMFDHDNGLINAPVWWLAETFKIPVQPPEWLTSTAWAKPSVVILTLWKNIGFTVVIFLAGLQAIPLELHEAAAIDGANNRQRFWRITLPLLSPTTFFVLVILTIGSFQLFDEAFVMTRGGPANASLTAVGYIYNTAFGTTSRMGKAAAISWVLFAMIFIFTLIQQRLQQRWVYYEAGESA